MVFALGLHIRRAAFAALLIAISVASGACKNDAERLRERTDRHLGNVVRILEDHKGNDTDALAELLHYGSTNKADLRAIRQEGKAVLAALDEQGRERFEAESRTRQMALLAEIENLARTYERPDDILRLVFPIVSPPVDGPRSKVVSPLSPLAPTPHPESGGGSVQGSVPPVEPGRTPAPAQATPP